MNTTGRASKGEAQISVNSGYLRIQLPRTLYEGKQKFLSLNLPDTPENQAKAKVILTNIQRDIDYNNFDLTLEKYRNPSKDAVSILNEKSQPKSLTFQEMLDEFETKYFRKRKRGRKGEDTFSQHKKFVINIFKGHSDFNFYLSKEIINDAINLLKPGTASRTKSIDSLKVFLKCFQFDYKPRRGIASGYKPKHRNLPTDERIIEAWHEIQKEGKCCSVAYRGNGQSWGWLFTVVATYGLRPHEILAIDYEKSFKPPFYPLYIDENIVDGGTKTGSRIVFPIPLEWVQLFDITNLKTKYLEETEINFSKRIAKFGDGLGGRMRDMKIGFVLYDMRHRYAVRGRELGFNIQVLAKWCGHTYTKQTEIYQKYMPNYSHSLIYQDGVSRKYELEKIRQGGLSYSELETEVEKAKLRLAQLETERRLIIAQKQALATPTNKPKKSTKPTDDTHIQLNLFD